MNEQIAFRAKMESNIQLARHSGLVYRLRLDSVLDKHIFSMESDAKKISQFRNNHMLCL